MIRLVRRAPAAPDERRWDPPSGVVDASALNPELDLWFDPRFQDIREFVMTFAVPQIAAALAARAGRDVPLSGAVVREAMTTVMTRSDTEIRCARATRSFEAKVPVKGDHTPICFQAAS